MISLERINVKDHIFSRQGELILSLDLCNMPNLFYYIIVPPYLYSEKKME